ncbi:GyrI-like domain-containing protein [Chitinophaga nivalis]|uniref:GyrI-like domain-containing protein n=1 Tax=Chitinophaga nivalis TaxID=2991709 RepID=A0ABT3IU16_9BACT|nr:GyrI-like domain-containing protein [Chitinophaga nivalis]MCW3462828.1 GyrI-like domain-containing protein [Chitinophaga nivalis]MCW3487482.1 GyrI-like domain-containing protein [Chitinophaga nivalis]
MRTYIYGGWVLLLTFLCDHLQTLTDMTKLDLTKVYKNYYTATLAPQLVTIEKGLFLTITGKGDPNGAAFAETTSALYTVAYTIKNSSKELGRDFTVAKLEGFWWVNVTTEDPMLVPRDQWHYELAIRLPEEVTRQQFITAVMTAERKKKSTLFREVDFRYMEEGRCAQILHVGPYSEEPVSLKKLDELIKREQLQVTGRHHEIYLSDPRKSSPEKRKTILRIAVSS